MGKKGAGERHLKPRMSSSSTSFARRGDPWISDKEGLRDFGRNLDTENPDMDMFTKARKAEPKSIFKDSPRVELGNDFHKRKAKISFAMNQKLVKLRKGANVVPDLKQHFKLCFGCNHSVQCIAVGKCIGFATGEKK
jgi:hypothetical protein